MSTIIEKWRQRNVIRGKDDLLSWDAFAGKTPAEIAATSSPATVKPSVPRSPRQ